MAILSVRIRDDQKAKLDATASRLGVSISDLIQADVERICGLPDEWECRETQWLGDRIVGIGADPSTTKSGLQLPVLLSPILAPLRLWAHLERAVRK